MPNINNHSASPFLQLVATDLIEKYGNDLSHITVVFPNKRSRLFLNQYLVATAVDERPIWAPKYQTINELFLSLTPHSVADPLDVVCRIHRLYVQLTGSEETLDYFFGWGERLLSDFDNIDKNMADTSRLLRNLADIKELESKGFLDEEQERTLQEFFRDFSLKENTHIRERFLSLWNQLLPLYTALNAELFAEGIAYEGALYRSVIQSLTKGNTLPDPSVKKYVFIGFNVLNKVEESLFLWLKKNDQALFYWDYDTFYVHEHTHFEAGYFLRKNLELFPNELPASAFNNIRQNANNPSCEQHVELFAATSETAQAQLASQWLNRHAPASSTSRTAIVLCNENLLLPILHTLPTHCSDINITKGYPLSHTTAYAYLNKWLYEAETKQKNTSLTSLLEKLSSDIQQQATATTHTADATATFTDLLQCEAYYKCHTIIHRFRTLVEKHHLDISIHTLHQLVKQVARQASIPFRGEPAVGLQIMGMLETRCLDFDNILLLSAGEGNLPEHNTDFSFIPYPLRVEYGLSTSRHRNALSAYYFFRLLQRAKNISIAYNAASEGLSRGEMSRFITQYLLEIPRQKPVAAFQLSTDGTLAHDNTLHAFPVIPKKHPIYKQIAEISPSGINTYLRCPIQFFFEKIARLKEPPTPPDVIEPNTMGSIFHKAAEYIYAPGDSTETKVISTDYLSKFLTKEGRKCLMQYVRQAFEEEKTQYNVIFAEVITAYLETLIRHDLSLTPFTVEAVERDTAKELSIPTIDGDNASAVLKGKIDRIDTVQLDSITTYRVLDYKTGGQPEYANSLEQLFEAGPKHPHYMLQACLYALTLVNESQYPIAPALFFVHKAANKDYTPYLSINKERIQCFQKLAAPFEALLVKLLAEIAGTEVPFRPTDEENRCNSCPFRQLCTIG